jgi:hypothetical protein
LGQIEKPDHLAWGQMLDNVTEEDSTQPIGLAFKIFKRPSLHNVKTLRSAGRDRLRRCIDPYGLVARRFQLS